MLSEILDVVRYCSVFDFLLHQCLHWKCSILFCLYIYLLCLLTILFIFYLKEIDFTAVGVYLECFLTNLIIMKGIGINNTGLEHLRIVIRINNLILVQQILSLVVG